VRVAALVVTHRGGRLLSECLASMRAQSRPVDELLVVVSADADLEVDAPALQLRANVGYARAVNAGALATVGRPRDPASHLLVLNDDTRLDPDCVAALVAAAEGGPPAIHQPRIVLADESGRLDNVGHGYFPDGFVWSRGRDAPESAGLPAGDPGAFSGAAVLIAREVWEALGGFDARFGSFAEDVDLSLRALRRGIPIVAVPEARVEHHLGASYGRTGADKLRRLERNRVRAAFRSLPASLLVTMPAWTAARYALFAGLALAGRGPGGDVPPDARFAALRGVWDGFRDAPEALRLRAADRPSWTRGERDMLRALWAGRARWEDACR
jgi:N-acetylglucosaminyl-diphospho-decaprenol L-rhamnosyltransferase